MNLLPNQLVVITFIIKFDGDLERYYYHNKDGTGKTDQVPPIERNN